MKNNKTKMREDQKYLTPLCVMVDIVSEGILCASIQQLEDEGELSWDN